MTNQKISEAGLSVGRIHRITFYATTIKKALFQAVEEFEMKQIIESYENGEGNDLKPRSLVFRISKRINKASTNKKEELSQSTCAKETANSKKILESVEQKSSTPADSFIQYSANIKHLPRSETAEKTDNLENRFSIKMPKSVVEPTENKGPTLRRTSRRIIVKPVNKEFLSESEMRKKNSEILKEKECNSEFLKKGPNTGKMGKRKRGRKSFASALMQKIEPIRRGRGRPRTINRDIPIHSSEKFVSLKGSKPIRKPSLPAKQRNDLTVWNLMPNECVDSEYFKSHIMKMQHGKPRGRKPKNAPILTLTPMSVGIPHMPLSNRENVEIRFPKMTPIAKKPVIHQNQEFHAAASSRPTVIYFKEPKNYTNCNPHGREANQSIINQRNMPYDQQLVTPFKDFRNTVYLRRKYGNLIDDATFEYAYGFFQGDLQKTDEFIKVIILGRKQLIAECGTHPNEKCCAKNRFPPFQMNRSISDQTVQNTSSLSDVSDSQSSQDDLFISCRQVIVDSIRILYDEASVLGYE
ncbi:uncharacterized protein TNCT_699041 [Trichonephila clavata]|uniref:Uncharacterized protein n=1 Tax=Trichonephila clavata TaxID=2740835 RepID=A0A8X6KB23_TRICU|nr:uncharacterized protein TNCT_699041 [Trichonephila clavata]